MLLQWTGMTKSWNGDCKSMGEAVRELKKQCPPRHVLDLTYHWTWPVPVIRSLLLLWLEYIDGSLKFKPFIWWKIWCYFCCWGHMSFQCTHLFLYCIYTKLRAAHHLVHNSVYCGYHQYFARDTGWSCTQGGGCLGLCAIGVIVSYKRLYDYFWG